ncbi:MAG: FAD-dependent oxidoreductase [Pirellulales bacterium]|nr:FAD-dependent oxidoreductase [Pirellulales bacterium]
MSISLSRREVLAAFLTAPAATFLGCGSMGSSLPVAGEIIGTSQGIGHRLRQGFRPQPTENSWTEADVVIVGGGMAGLSAAWRLSALGIQDVAILELEPRLGGTSASGVSNLVRYPWGAHYVPAPTSRNRVLVTLFEELGLLEGFDEDGEPVIGEPFLCRDPEERLFHNGTWHEGLYPYSGASEDDLAQLARFESEIERWVAWRDSTGRRAFTLPIAACSDEADVRALDELTMSDWLAEHDLTSARLRWLVNYCCKDDYGLMADQTSAWAGLFYFASRIRVPGGAPQPLVTFPEGNGRFIRYFQQVLSSKIHTGMAVSEIRLASGGNRERDARSSESAPLREIISVSHDGSTVRGFRARNMVFAASQFLGPYLISDLSESRRQAAREFQYGSWLVANLHLNDRPEDEGFPLAWDNVLYDSKSLGYVTATHQRNLEFGPTVLTYYYPFCDAEPAVSRQRLLDLTWEDCAEIALADLQTAHPQIRSLTTRLDVMKWGHAMIQPRTGFVFHQARRTAAKPFAGIHFANTDLSGVALLEEALYHGVRAAEEVATARGRQFTSLI